MAVRLEKAFGAPAREWLIRQLDYELTEVMRRAMEYCRMFDKAILSHAEDLELTSFALTSAALPW